MSEELHCQHAERAVLSAILNFEEAIFTVSRHLKPHHFSCPDYQKIYDACLEVERRDVPVDVVNVGQVLRQRKSGDLLQKMASLLTVPSTTAHIQHHVGIICDQYLRQSVLSIVRGIDTESGAEALAELNHRLRRIERDIAVVDDDSLLLSDEDIQKRLSQLADTTTEAKTIFKSGIDELDRIIGGFQVGTVTTLQGLYKTGKTKFLIMILVRCARDGVPVGFFTGLSPIIL